MATFACYPLTLISFTINFLHSEKNRQAVKRLLAQVPLLYQKHACTVLTMQIQKACTRERILWKYFKLIYKNKQTANLYVKP